MSKLASPYYPPRAKWYGSWLRLLDALRRCARLDRIHWPGGIAFGDFFKTLLWPGVGFYVRGEKLIGKAIMLGAALLMAVFIVWIGHGIANVAFGLLISAHVTSIVFLMTPWLAGARFGFRLAFSLVILTLIGGGIYAPVRDLFQTHCLVPLRTNERVVVVQRLTSPRSIKPGDWIAYTLPTPGVTGVRLEEGLGLGPVLAIAGDRIQFTTNAFVVNGVAGKRQPHMPTAGEMVVPGKKLVRLAGACYNRPRKRGRSGYRRSDASFNWPPFPNRRFWENRSDDGSGGDKF